MKNITKKIILILAILMLLFSINSRVYAFGTIVQDGQDFISSADKGKAKIGIEAGDLKDLSGFLYNALLSAGVVIAVIVATVLGIQFVLGGAEGQAKVKEMLVPFVVGSVVVFGGFGIWKIALNIGGMVSLTTITEPGTSTTETETSSTETEMSTTDDEMNKDKKNNNSINYGYGRGYYNAINDLYLSYDEYVNMINKGKSGTETSTVKPITDEEAKKTADEALKKAKDEKPGPYSEQYYIQQEIQKLKELQKMFPENSQEYKNLQKEIEEYESRLTSQSTTTQTETNSGTSTTQTNTKQTGTSTGTSSTETRVEPAQTETDTETVRYYYNYGENVGKDWVNDITSDLENLDNDDLNSLNNTWLKTMDDAKNKRDNATKESDVAYWAGFYSYLNSAYQNFDDYLTGTGTSDSGIIIGP